VTRPNGHPAWCRPDQCTAGRYPAGGHAGQVSTVLDRDVAVEAQLHQAIGAAQCSVVLAVYRGVAEDYGLTLSLAGAQELSSVLRGNACRSGG